MITFMGEDGFESPITMKINDNLDVLLQFKNYKLSDAQLLQEQKLEDDGSTFFYMQKSAVGFEEALKNNEKCKDIREFRKLVNNLREA